MTTQKFQDWFGDSAVTDTGKPGGQPLVVYHGTAADFESFDNSKTGANDGGLWGRGHYFSAVVEGPNSYALRQGDGARVIAAYVSIKRPLFLKTGSDLVTRLPDGTNCRELLGPNLDGAKIKEIAISGGNDGVIQIRPNGLIGDVVAYNPEQIKSAIGNNGDFNSDNQDIRFSMPEAAPQDDFWSNVVRDPAKAGAPQMVFHGTPKGEIAFEKRDRGIYFTSSAKLAEGYTYGNFMRGGKNPAIYPAYLSMGNPLVIDAYGKRNDNIPVPWAEWKPKVFGNLPKTAVSVEAAFARALAEGHDGLIVRNVVDSNAIDERTKGDVYVVAGPDQIKSAIGNFETHEDEDVQQDAPAP